MEKGGKKTYKQYIGRYYHLLDEKGRVSIPVAFRKQLTQEVVVTNGLDGALFLFNTDQWESFVSRLESSSFFRKINRDLQRLMLNSAVWLKQDSIGRLLLPEFLLQSGDLKKEVVFAGSGDRVEIWDRTRYHAYLEQIEQNAESIAEEFDQGQQGGNREQ